MTPVAFTWWLVLTAVTVAVVAFGSLLLNGHPVAATTLGLAALLLGFQLVSQVVA